MNIKIGYSKRNKDYMISINNIYEWLNFHKHNQFVKAYNKSKSSQPIFKWLADRLPDCYYDLDLDKSTVVIDLGFMKIKSPMEIVEIR